MIIRNGVIVIAAIKGDGVHTSNPNEVVVADGVIARPAIKSDGGYSIIRADAVTADGVIPRIPHEGDHVNIMVMVR